MQTKHLCVLINIWTKGEVGASINRLKSSNKIDFLTLLLSWIIFVISDFVLFCFRSLLFIGAFWSPARKGLTSCLSFVMSNCEIVTFPLVSSVRCGAWLYQFLIYALFLTFFMLSLEMVDGLQPFFIYTRIVYQSDTTISWLDFE